MRRLAALLPGIVALSLGACAVPPPSGRDLIGTLEVDGPNAYLGGQAARTGDRVYHGNTISTAASG